MAAIQFIFKTISGALSLFMFLCLIRIFLTWIPELNNSKVGYYLSQICDPYLEIFRRMHIFRFAGIDFSPILSLGILTLLASLFSELSIYGVFRFGVIIASLLNVCWSLVSSIIGLLNVLCGIRLVFFLLKKESYTPLWNNIDRTIYGVSAKITRLFKKQGAFSFKTQLIIVLAAGIVVQALGGIVIGKIAHLIAHLPF